MQEVSAWSAVISQAIIDADLYLRKAWTKRDGRNSSQCTQQEAQDAWNFLTAEYGPWARSRMDIAHIAGIDPDCLRQRVLVAQERDGHLASLKEKPAKRKRGQDE